jgi:hypothetical protein
MQRVLGCMGKEEEKKKQTDINHTQDGIGHGYKSAGQGQGEGEQRDGKWRRDKTAECVEYEPHDHHHMKPEQNRVEYAEWELHQHGLQARWPQYEQKIAEGMGHVDKGWGPHHHHQACRARRTTT